MQDHCGIRAADWAVLGGRSTLALERMSRTCPNCRAAIPFPTIRGLRVRYSSSPDVRWYRFSPGRIWCRSCGAELKRVPRRVGHVILGLVWLVYATCFLAVWFHPAALVAHPIGVAAGIILLVLPFFVWYDIQGTTLVTIGDATSLGKKHAL
jgi:hypothetical protein